jgi:hypothetical protein
MHTSATIFFLIVGQAYDGGSLAIIPAHYESLQICEAAGEDARRTNQGLNHLSYTCVPAFVNVPPCDAVCEIIEATP